MSVKNKNAHYKKEAGFTLVELTIVILIFGALAGSLSWGLKIWYGSRNHYVVETNIDNATQAVKLFYGDVGRYPCPANPALLETDPNYGAEDCTLAMVPGENPTNDPVYIGNFPIYAFNNDDGTPSLLAVDKIYLRSLLAGLTNTKVEGNDIKDPWNGNFVYGVTVSQTVTSDGDVTTLGDFDPSRGSIRVMDEFDRDTGGTNGNAHFVVLSRGKDSRCLIHMAPTALEAAEEENCDNDAVFKTALFSDSANNYYDDYVRFKRSQSVGIWSPIIGSTDLYPIPNGKITIGPGYEQNPPAGLNLRLDVEGNMIVEERIAAQLVCDDSGQTKCFNPASLYTLDCPSGTYMKGVSIDGSQNLSADCQAINFLNNAENCPAGEYLNGIFTDGQNRVCISP